MTCSNWADVIENVAFFAMIALIVWANTRNK
jgi:hypothetical protein